MRPVTRTRPGPGRRWAVAACLAGAAFVAGCGTGGPSSPASSPAPPAGSSPAGSSPAATMLCQDAAALRASLAGLTSVKVGAGTVSEITADLRDVQARLTVFVADAKGQWQAQTAALTSALGTLGSEVKKLAGQPSSAAVSAVVIAFGDVNTAARNLLAAVSTDCPSVSPPASTAATPNAS